jgi:Mlc titration factor MtfA (ptsG expression regulator)
MFGFLKRRRRERVLKTAQLDEAAWAQELEAYNFTRVLNTIERVRLRELVLLFLSEKPINAAGDLNLDNRARLSIAIQACMLILNLDLDWYRTWVEIIVYPAEFVAHRDQVDEAGVVHSVTEPMAGESWDHGTVVLSWADVMQAGKGAGYNVVMHEFAHQLDMLNGEPDGYPPLHAGMSREQWTQTFGAAYEHFCKRVDDWEETVIDEYAAEDPGEFFAVMSEAFFEMPQAVRDEYPEVYQQLAKFYRQDPAQRNGGD